MVVGGSVAAVWSWWCCGMWLMVVVPWHGDCCFCCIVSWLPHCGIVIVGVAVSFLLCCVLTICCWHCCWCCSWRGGWWSCPIVGIVVVVAAALLLVVLPSFWFAFFCHYFRKFQGFSLGLTINCSLTHCCPGVSTLKLCTCQFTKVFYYILNTFFLPWWLLCCHLFFSRIAMETNKKRVDS